MKKTIYIPRGQHQEYDSLVCENIVVNGYLKVTGGITSKKISGAGAIKANVIKADSIVAHDITAGYIVTDELAAKRVSTVSITASRSIAVSSHLESGYVNTPKAIIAQADVEDMQVSEIEKLSPKEHSLFGALLLSTTKSLLVELLAMLKNLFEGLPKTEKSSPVKDDDTESDIKTDDPDFQAFVRMYKAFYESKPVDASEVINERHAA